MISVPNLRPFWYYSLYKPPFRVRSGDVASNCPVRRFPWGTMRDAVYNDFLVQLGVHRGYHSVGNAHIETSRTPFRTNMEDHLNRSFLLM